MNIKQIQQDLDNGVLLGRETVRELANVAVRMLEALQWVQRLDNADAISACSTGEPVTTYEFQDAMCAVDMAIEIALGGAV